MGARRGANAGAGYAPGYSERAPIARSPWPIAVDSGQVAVNGGAMSIETPFGGYKMSGIGREKGIEALYEYTQLKTVSSACRTSVPSDGTPPLPVRTLDPVWVRNGQGSRAVEGGVRRLNSAAQEPCWFRILPHSTCLTP
ncbi:aldehyde dehydrogenase family protein [Streptomyces sp. NPDC048420]|uniref:aldehyde dehydrogenase family protein n=1 Tax=Streptomyces sp. NPDC048420 TaxID=3155755 RepID=UPI0034337FD4